MHVITRRCVLFLWMHTLTFVKSQDCTREQFINGPLYDSNFDTSDMEASYSGGRQVRVGCNVGYSGFFKLMCVEGRWEPKGNNCQPKSCGHPGDGQFSDFHLEKGDDFVFGSQVVYTCHKGYQMQSRTNYRHCMAEGWDGVVPVCEAQKCPAIHVANNVKVIGDPEEATYGNVVRFSCRYNTEILAGPTEIYCDENGDWSAGPPICEAIKCTVPKIEHGHVSGDIQEYKEHEFLTFVCNAKFKPAEERPSKCTKVGTKAEWSPTPRCEPVTCKLPQSAEGTRYEPASRNVFSPGDTVRVTCRQKYWVSNHQHTSAVTRCRDDGDWTIRPICQEVICSNPRDPLVDYWGTYHGQQIKLDQTVSYNCETGYKRTAGVSRATCSRDGWRPNPLCEAITCNREVIKNADTVNDKLEFKYNEQVDYVCKDGYQGRFTRTCGERGWTGRSQCTEIKCDKQVIENADIVSSNKRKNTFKYNEQVSYVCKDGYRGNFTRTCGESGWTGPSKCTACPNIEVQRGFVAGPFNGTLYYACNKGYKLFTKAWWGRVKCNGTVPSEPVQCIEQGQCGEMPVIPNIKERHQHNVYRDGNSTQIICKEGYQAEEGRLTCHEGKWHVNGEICKPIANLCSPPPKVDNAVIETPYQKEYLSGSKETYKCRNKYTLEGNDTIVCTDGNWNKSDINCTPIKCTVPDIEHGHVSGDIQEYKEHEFLTFVCNAKFKPAEERPSKCTKVGTKAEWSPTPRCEPPTQEQ